MSESELYRQGGTIRTSNINKRNAEDSAELNAIKASQRDSQLMDSAREEGFREGFQDFERRMVNSDQWSPVAEGSPEDIQMQENINRGLSFKESEEPSLLDSISSFFGGSDSAPVQDTSSAPQSAFLQGQQHDLMQQESEQAGLAELEQLLNKR